MEGQPIAQAHFPASFPGEIGLLSYDEQQSGITKLCLQNGGLEGENGVEISFFDISDISSIPNLEKDSQIRVIDIILITKDGNSN